MNIRLSSRLAIIALAASVLSAPVLAQQPTPQPARPAPPSLTPPSLTPPALQPVRPAAPAAQAAPQQSEPDTIPIPQATSAHLSAARELVVRSGMSRSFEAAIPNMMRQLNTTVTRTRPELTNDLKVTLDQLLPEFMKLSDEMVENGARIYTALLNEQECKDAVAFFKSPLGTKFIDVQPIIFGNLADVMEPWTKHLSQVMYERARDEMKKKGHQI